MKKKKTVVQCYYQCEVCNKRWIAIDSIVIDQACPVCKTPCDPKKTVAYQDRYIQGE